MEQFYVVADDGQKYGPADAGLLARWALEDRIGPDSILEYMDGRRCAADQVVTFGPPMPAPGAISPGALAAAGNFAGSAAAFPQSVNAYGETPYPRSEGTSLDVLPHEIASKKFNFGAFWFSWLWLCFHGKVGLGLALFFGSIVLGIIPFGGIVPLVASLFIGFSGYKLAWQSGKFQTAEQCIAVQKKWSLWAGIFLLATLALVALSIVMALMSGPVTATKQSGKSKKTYKREVIPSPAAKMHK
ncbi:MAG: hypothetical protein JST40_00010 [Armatimonadetes bacterium]|nr:hypothetical protein [Armatimonadota bacterium]